MKPIETIAAFDEFLQRKGASFDGVVIGGAALAILGVISRETRDCDVLDPEIPEEIQNLSKEFAKAQTEKGNILRPDWLNNGPSSLVKNLPKGWRSRMVTLFDGKTLKLTTLGRSDLLKTKLFALCDRGTDRQDCLALRPTLEEIAECRAWLRAQDANPGWPKHVEETLKVLSKELGHGV